MTFDAGFQPLDPRVRMRWTIGSAGSGMLLTITALVALAFVEAPRALVVAIAIGGLGLALGAAVAASGVDAMAVVGRVARARAAATGW